MIQRDRSILAGAFLAVAAFAYGAAAAPVPPNFSLPSTASFEECHWYGDAARYEGRAGNAIATLQAGGAVSIHLASGSILRMTFPGANPASQPIGEGRSTEQSIYYVGAPRNWHTDAHFARVRYPEIYPGIDLVFLFNLDQQLEYNFEIAPQSDPAAIRVRYEGGVPSLDAHGNLEVRAGGSKLTQPRPLAFERRGARVKCEYRIRGQEVSLHLANYDRTQALVIDPVLNFSTYLGGSGFDAIYGMVRDASGNVYVTGETSSGSLTNPVSPSRPTRVAFVAKLNSNATQVLFTIYLGGNGDNSGQGIALDGSGNVYVTGVTGSSDFPVTLGALLTTAPGSQDAFVAKLSSIGALQYSTYLGGVKPDYGLSIAVDAAGEAFVAGQAESPAFPVTSGAFQTTNHGGVSDCFVSKLNAAGSALKYSTLLGGSGMDLCSGIALDSSGNAYVTGTTHSPDFPTTSALQGSLNGTANAFVAEINPNGTGLVYSTYLGGSGTDNANAIATDASGAAYIVGTTSSVDFPNIPGSIQTALRGTNNAFVAKVSAGGSALAYSTVLGGSQSDTATAIAVDTLGRAVVAGYTASPDFPMATPIQSTFGGALDSFAAVVDPVGATLLFSSYFGGAGDDRAYSILVAPGNELYLAGTTASSNFPVLAAFQPAMHVANDAFVLQVNYTPIVRVSPVSVTPHGGSGSSGVFAFTFNDPNGAADIVSTQLDINAALLPNSACYLYYTQASNTIALASNAGAWQSGLAIGASGTSQNTQCSINAGASSVVVSGTTLTLNLALTFSTAFAGGKNVYMEVRNATADSGWWQKGTWTVPETWPSPLSPPLPVSVTPDGGNSTGNTFTFTFTDSNGAADIASAQINVNAALVAHRSCYLQYTRATNKIALASDAGAWQSGLVIGSGGTSQNSQCTINASASSASASGTTLTLNLALTFTASFAGGKNVYMEVRNATVDSGWWQEGTWTVPQAAMSSPPAPPMPASVTPSGGSGASPVFAFTFTDPNGAADIVSAQMDLNATLVPTKACYLSYTRASNTIALASDAGVLQSLPIGSAGTLQNSQCTINAGASSVTASGTTLTLNLALSFSGSFAGAKNIYMDVSNAAMSSGWLLMGAWVVP